MKTVEFMGMTLMLDTKAKIQLEDKIGSPLKYVFGLMGEAMTEEEMDITKFELPPLKVMILTIHASAQKLNANVSVEKVMDKVDEFLEEKSVIELFTVFMELLKVGRYLPEEQE
jgi:hypothetical protein